EDGLTFVRTPTSAKNVDDVNVTTTCSCLMALSLTDQAGVVYDDPRVNVPAAFRALVSAPWMSSGLTENNPFTTALVIRTLGFLLKGNMLPKDIPNEANIKKWEVGLGVDDVNELVAKLKSPSTPIMKLISLSLSDTACRKLASWKTGEEDK